MDYNYSFDSTKFDIQKRNTMFHSIMEVNKTIFKIFANSFNYNNMYYSFYKNK